MITAYPRKGTITQDEQSNQEHFDCSLSPQGDDNRRRLQWVHTSRTDCSLSPQGDDNFTSIGSPHNLHRLQLIPARGQKTPHQKMRSFSFTNLNFLFSVGCSSMNGTIAAAVIFSLLRLLHSDKMCYNKANSKHLLQNWQIRFPFIVQFFHNP